MHDTLSQIPSPCYVLEEELLRRILQMFGFLISDEKLFMQKLYHFP